MVIILSNIFEYVKKIRWYHSIRWKLFITYLMISFIPLLIFFSAILMSIEDYFIQDRQKKLMESAVIIAGTVLKGNYMTDLSEPKKMLFDNDLDVRSREGGFRILVLDSKCVIINDSNKMETGKTYLVNEVINALNRKSDVSLHKREQAIYAATAIENDKNEKLGAVLLVLSVEDVNVELQDIQQRLLLFTVLVSLILAVLVFFLSQIVISPLNRILKEIRKMADGQFHHRISVKGRDEYFQMGQAFNTMTEKLEQVEKTREEFVSNVSHELKTPLSSIKVLADSVLMQEDVPPEIYKEFLMDISSEVDRMTFIINDLLALVKLDQREVRLNIRPVNINEMVEGLLKRLYPLAERKSIDILYEDVREVVCDADEVKLSIAISNLVDNAIKYTPGRGTIKVTVDADLQNAFITVKDTGIGISEAEQSKVFNRFYRVDKTRDRETGGTGLGLAISHSTILLHNGSIRLISKENEGSTFTVRIPLHQI